MLIKSDALASVNNSPNENLDNQPQNLDVALQNLDVPPSENTVAATAKNAVDFSQSEFEAIKKRESLSLKSYWDFKGYSIGYGHFIVPADGVGDGKTWTITESKAVELLSADIERASQAVRDAVNVPINQNQFDACVDLAYNIGATAFKNSTLVKRINAGDPLAGESFLSWVKVTVDGVKKTSQALLNRRIDNQSTFNG